MLDWAKLHVPNSLQPRGSVITRTALRDGVDLDVDLLLPRDLVEWRLDGIERLTNKERGDWFRRKLTEMLRVMCPAKGTFFTSKTDNPTRSLTLVASINGTNIDIDLFPKVLDEKGSVWSPSKNRDADGEREWQSVPYHLPLVTTDKWTAEQHLAVLIIKLWKLKHKNEREKKFKDLDTLETKQDTQKLSAAESANLNSLKLELHQFDFPKGYHLNLAMEHLARTDIAVSSDDAQLRVHRVLDYVQRMAGFLRLAYDSYFGLTKEFMSTDTAEGTSTQRFLQDVSIASDIINTFGNHGEHFLKEMETGCWTWQRHHPRGKRSLTPLQVQVTDRLTLLLDSVKTIQSQGRLAPDGFSAFSTFPKFEYSYEFQHHFSWSHKLLGLEMVVGSPHSPAAASLPLGSVAMNSATFGSDADTLLRFLAALSDSMSKEPLSRQGPLPTVSSIFQVSVVSAEQPWTFQLVAAEAYLKFGLPNPSQSQCIVHVVHSRLKQLRRHCGPLELSFETVGFLGDKLVWLLQGCDYLASGSISRYLHLNVKYLDILSGYLTICRSIEKSRSFALTDSEISNRNCSVAQARWGRDRRVSLFVPLNLPSSCLLVAVIMSELVCTRTARLDASKSSEWDI